jgi:hypothetical protein
VKKLEGFLSLFFILIFVGCSTGGTEPTPAPDEEPYPANDIFPRPTVTPVPDDETYPAPDEQTEELEAYPPPRTPVEPEAYPPPSDSDSDAYPPPPPTPAQESYPDPESAATDLIWVIRPVGEQCAAETDYADLQAAVADLIAIGVHVETSETIDLIVCQACGCPTSAHFRAQIPASDFSDAEQLGWLQEEP